VSVAGFCLSLIVASFTKGISVRIVLTINALIWECLPNLSQLYSVCLFDNFVGIYEMFCNHKNFYIGKQPEPFPGTDTVCAQYMAMLHSLKLN